MDDDMSGSRMAILAVLMGRPVKLTFELAALSTGPLLNKKKKKKRHFLPFPSYRFLFTSCESAASPPAFHQLNGGTCSIDQS